MQTQKQREKQLPCNQKWQAPFSCAVKHLITQ